MVFGENNNIVFIDEIKDKLILEELEFKTIICYEFLCEIEFSYLRSCTIIILCNAKIVNINNCTDCIFIIQCEHIIFDGCFHSFIFINSINPIIIDHSNNLHFSINTEFIVSKIHREPLSLIITDINAFTSELNKPNYVEVNDIDSWILWKYRFKFLQLDKDCDNLISFEEFHEFIKLKGICFSFKSYNELYEFFIKNKSRIVKHIYIPFSTFLFYLNYHSVQYSLLFEDVFMFDPPISSLLPNTHKASPIINLSFNSPQINKNIKEEVQIHKLSIDYISSSESEEIITEKSDLLNNNFNITEKLNDECSSSIVDTTFSSDTTQEIQESSKTRVLIPTKYSKLVSSSLFPKILIPVLIQNNLVYYKIKLFGKGKAECIKSALLLFGVSISIKKSEEIEYCIDCGFKNNKKVDSEFLQNKEKGFRSLLSQEFDTNFSDYTYNSLTCILSYFHSLNTFEIDNNKLLKAANLFNEFIGRKQIKMEDMTSLKMLKKKYIEKDAIITNDSIKELFSFFQINLSPKKTEKIISNCKRRLNEKLLKTRDFYYCIYYNICKNIDQDLSFSSQFNPIKYSDAEINELKKQIKVKLNPEIIVRIKKLQENYDINYAIDEILESILLLLKITNTKTDEVKLSQQLRLFIIKNEKFNQEEFTKIITSNSNKTEILKFILNTVFYDLNNLVYLESIQNKLLIHKYNISELESQQIVVYRSKVKEILFNKKSIIEIFHFILKIFKLKWAYNSILKYLSFLKSKISFDDFFSGYIVYLQKIYKNNLFSLALPHSNHDQSILNELLNGKFIKESLVDLPSLFAQYYDVPLVYAVIDAIYHTYNWIDGKNGKFQVQKMKVGYFIKDELIEDKTEKKELTSQCARKLTFQEEKINKLKYNIGSIHSKHTFMLNLYKQFKINSRSCGGVFSNFMKIRKEIIMNENLGIHRLLYQVDKKILNNEFGINEYIEDYNIYKDNIVEYESKTEKPQKVDELHREERIKCRRVPIPSHIIRTKKKKVKLNEKT